MSHAHNTRSQAKKCHTEDDTEDEVDYQSLSDETEVHESTIMQSETDQPLMNTMAQLIMQMQKDQQRRDEEQIRRDEEQIRRDEERQRRMQEDQQRRDEEQARRDEEQARRDEEHRMQMQIMTETLAKLQAGDPNSEQTGARTKAKKVHYPILGPVQDVKMADFRTWREGYEGYVNVAKLGTECDLVSRRSMIRSAIDSSWQKLWTSGVLAIDADDDIADIMDKMYRYLRSQRNPLLDRKDFFNRNQHASEKVDEYYAELQDLYDSCDFGTPHCPSCEEKYVLDNGNTLRDERIRDRLIFGLRSESIQQKVLEEDFEKLTLEKTHKIVQAAEASKQTTGDLRKDEPSIHKLEERKEKHKPRLQKSSYKKAKMQGSNQDQKPCKRCGREHKPKQCPAYESTCNNCKEKGHWEKFCKSKKSHNGKGTGQLRTLMTGQLASVTTIAHMAKLDLHDRSSPPVLEFMTCIGQKKKVLSWLLDTGAEVCAIGKNMLKSFGTVDIQRPDMALHVANQKEVAIEGQVKATICHQGNKLETNVYVLPGLKNPILSFDAVKTLNFLNCNWPMDTSMSVAAISLGPADIRQEIMPTEEVSNEKLRHELFQEFEDIFPEETSTQPLKAMTGPLMRIELEPDAKPFKRYKANTLPFHWQAQVKRQLDAMVQKDIIESVPIGEVKDWVLGMVVLQKPNSEELRITIDFGPVNKYIKRQGYPTKTPSEEIAQIPAGMLYFTTLDGRHGYWQVELEESSRPYTTFITQWGHYRFKRNVMGLISAGDEHNLRGDRALDGIKNVRKVVEDILIYDKDYDEHIERVKQVLERCKENGITLSRKKAHFAQKQVQWCGYKLSEDGYTVTPKLVEALQSFPVPTGRTDVRSFCGLVQQFEALSPDLTDLMAPIRSLLSPKSAFLWTEVQQKAFDDTLKELCSTRVLTLFRPEANLRLETDAAQKTGYGYALWQEEPDGIWKLLRCGSKTVTPAQSRYSVTESELAAVVYAVKKLPLYLKGKEFTVIVDHKPLISILNKKSLDEIETPRLINLKAKLMDYKMTAVWRPGVKHTVADVFSRHPVSPPSQDELEEEKEVEEYAEKFTLNCMAVVDPTLDKIRTEAVKDQVYNNLKNTIITGFPQKQFMSAELSPYWNVRDELSIVDNMILYGKRIVVPTSMRITVLKEIHAAHQGRERMLQRARQCVYWPGITNDISNIVRSCKECEIHKASQAKEPMIQDERPTRPGEAIAADIFNYEGKDYLVITDKLSGWNDVYDIARGATSQDVQKHFMKWFISLGVPNRITTDNGPQFRSGDFVAFCDDWGIKYDPSSPYHHVANGYAEAAVNAMKSIVKKTCPGRSVMCKAFWTALLEYRNTPKKDGLSPAQRLFQRPMRTRLPSHPQVFKPILQREIRLADKKALQLRAKAKAQYDQGSRKLKELKVGDIVRVQHCASKKWDLIAEVMVIKPRGRSYLVKSETGKIYWRNRRFLRLYKETHQDKMDDATHKQKKEMPLRRSTRPRKRPDYYQA